jgi:hypothetical protein
MAKKKARRSPAAKPRKQAAGRSKARAVSKKGTKRATARQPSRKPARKPARKAAPAAKPRKTAREAPATRPAPAPRHAPSLDRARKRLREIDENIPTPPSSLDLDRTASAARSGRREMREAILEHNETSPELTGGDVDADWQDAYSVGDEAPGGDNPTPDQDRVDDIAKALGVEYQDNEELRGSDKISDRDRHRWELDPASSEDYRDRD